MDVYCKKCGEPWALPLDMTESEIIRFRRGDGCPCCDWGKAAPERPPARAKAMAELESVLGDDYDGIAVELEDAEVLGLLDDE